MTVIGPLSGPLRPPGHWGRAGQIQPGSRPAQAASLGVTAGRSVVRHCASVNGTYADVSPAATITGSVRSFQAAVSQSGSAQFYRIHITCKNDRRKVWSS